MVNIHNNNHRGSNLQENLPEPARPAVTHQNAPQGLHQQLPGNQLRGDQLDSDQLHGNDEHHGCHQGAADFHDNHVSTPNTDPSPQHASPSPEFGNSPEREHLRSPAKLPPPAFRDSPYFQRGEQQPDQRSDPAAAPHHTEVAGESPNFAG